MVFEPGPTDRNWGLANAATLSRARDVVEKHDFAHPLSDAIEEITHSICTLEFEDHRPLYDWLVDNLIEGDPPRQYEFERLNLNYTVMSKRKLLQLVQVVIRSRSADGCGPIRAFVPAWASPAAPS